MNLQVGPKPVAESMEDGHSREPIDERSTSKNSKRKSTDSRTVDSPSKRQAVDQPMTEDLVKEMLNEIYSNNTLSEMQRQEKKRELFARPDV